MFYAEPHLPFILLLLSFNLLSFIKLAISDQLAKSFENFCLAYLGHCGRREKRERVLHEALTRDSEVKDLQRLFGDLHATTA